MIRSVFSRLPTIRYPSPFSLIWSSTGALSGSYKQHPCLYSPALYIRYHGSSLLLPRHVIRKPNQLGFAFSAASGRISFSFVSSSSPYSFSKFSPPPFYKDGNFFSCAHPIAACRSVAFRLYPKWEYTYLWSYPFGSSLFPVKPVTAPVILSRYTRAVPSPVPE